MESTIVEDRVREPDPESAAPWSPATRVAFRFFFCYFCLFLVSNSPLVTLLPFHGFLMAKHAALWTAVVGGLEKHLLHTGYELYLTEGEAAVSNTAFGTILCFCYLAIAAVATAAWSALDRRRLQYRRLHQVFRYLLRFSLALTMISYGVLKVIPTQMISPPPLGLLTQPVGDLTRMRLLWISTGASPAYETLVGCAELLGAVLLLLPRTTLLGGLLCAANLSMVFVLNMCYDVHVKLYSFHLLVMALLLVAPDAPRLANLFLFNRATDPSPALPVASNRWVNRGLQALLLAFCLFKIGAEFQETWARYKTFHPPRPPLYGIWNVEALTLDGREVPATDDPARWRWVGFFRPGAVTIKHALGSNQTYALDLDLKNRTMILRGKAPGPPPARLSITAPEDGAMILEGVLNGHATRAKLRKMALISRPFHWMFEAPKEDR